MKKEVMYFLLGVAAMGAFVFVVGRKRKKDSQPGPEVTARLGAAAVPVPGSTKQPLIPAIKTPYDSSIGATVSPAVSRGAKGIF